MLLVLIAVACGLILYVAVWANFIQWRTASAPVAMRRKRIGVNDDEVCPGIAMSAILSFLDNRDRCYGFFGIHFECQIMSELGSKPGLPPWGPHVRFRREQTLVREGSPLVKLRNSA